MTYTKEQIRNAFSKVPEVLKDAISAPESADIIKEISLQTGLNETQKGELASETGLVMMGLTKPEQFVANLMERLKIDPNKAREIGQKINEKIFRPIREDIINLNKPKLPVPPPPPPQRALHNTIDTSRMTEPLAAPELPRMKSVDADLLASVGARKPLPPPPPADKKPLDKILEAELLKKSEGVEFSPTIKQEDENLAHIEANQEKAELEKEISELEKESGGKKQGIPNGAPSKSDASSFSFSRGFIGKEDAESSLTREDILKAIENPGAPRRNLTAGIKEQLKPLRTMESDKIEAVEEKPAEAQAQDKQSPKQYSQDPYREPPK